MATTVYVARDGTGSFNCDGASDEVQINQAIDYVFNNSGSGYTTVYLKAGTYVISNPIRIRSGVTLCGAGKSVVTIKLANNITTNSSSDYYVPSGWEDSYGPMVPFIWTYGSYAYISNGKVTSSNQSVHDVSFYGFTLDGNYSNNSRVSRGCGYHNGIGLQYSTNVTIHDCHFTNSAGDGARIYGSSSTKTSNIYFYNNTATNLGHECLYVLFGTNVYAYNNNLEACINSSIRFNDVTNGHIYNNLLHASLTYTSNPVIQLQRQYWSTMTVEVYNNKIYESFGAGMWITWGRSPVAVADNGASTNIRIHNNMFYNNGTNHSIPYTAAIITDGMHNVYVENNTFVGNHGGGVVIMGMTTTATCPFSGIRVTVKNNIFLYNQLRKLNASGTTTQSDTGWGVQNRLSSTHTLVCSYNCFYGNVSGTYTGASIAEGNITADPLLANVSLTSGVSNQDYHLKSKSGRWYNGGWVKDTVNSPCIDKGDPTYTYDLEPEDNGGRVNIGMYANTSEASLSGEILGDSATLKDTRINSGAKDAVFSTSTMLDMGVDENLVTYRSLIWFDLSQYAGIEIEKATLSLCWYYPTTTRANSTVVELLRPASWVNNQATWNNRETGTAWEYPGGEWWDKDNVKYGTNSYATMTLRGDTPANGTYQSMDVTDLVQKYCYGIYENTGFFLRANLEVDNVFNRVIFYSSNSGTNTVIPKLTIKPAGAVVPTSETIYISSVADGTGSFKCDGVDDQIQINQAIKLMKENPNTYSRVYLKGPFTYRISSPILVAGTLEGDSDAVIKLVDNANWQPDVPMVKEYATGLSGIVIRGFSINGNREGNTNVISGKNYYNLIHLTSCSNINIYDMYLTNNHNDGLKLSSCSNVNYYNNLLYLLGHDGLYAINSSYINAHDNTIVCRTNSGLRLYNSNYVKLYRNIISSQGSGGAGIEVQKYGTPNMNDIEIYDNRIYGTVLAGIWAFASSSYNANTTGLNIHNNIIYGTGIKSSDPVAGGIVLNGFNANIDNNTIDGCYNSAIGIRETYDTAASITGTVTINIRSNHLTNTSGYGIKYTTLPNHTIVQINNCVYGNSSGDYYNLTAPTGDYANITSDPLYADRDNKDFHLQSKAGRWDTALNKWVIDAVNSPCIDAGYSEAPYSNEPEPNGDRINIGCYGNTSHASCSGTDPVMTNHPPVLGVITNKTVEIGDTLTFTVSGTDADDDVLTYTMSTLPVATGATLNSSTGVFSWTPALGQEGTYNVTFVVSDGIETDSQSITIGVIKQEMYTISSGEIYTNRLKQSTPTTVYNKLPYIDVGGRIISGANKKYRDLVMVDLSEYTGKTIINATLHIYWFFPDGRERVNNTTVEVYRPLPWDTNFATWNARNETTNWVVAGGDWYDAVDTLNGSVPFASVTFSGNTVPDNGYHELDVTSLVQEYVGGTYTNTGFFIKAQTEVDNYIAFYSQRFAITSKMLKLVVQYTD